MENTPQFSWSFSKFVFYLQTLDPNITDMPDMHFEMCDWIQECVETGKQEVCGMAFRNAAKSTIWGIWLPVWLLMRDPTTTILVMSADSHLAHRNAEAIQKTIMNTDICQHLIPDDRKTTWTKSNFNVRGHNRHSPHSSVTCKGILGNPVGFHGEYVLCDDLEIEKNVTNSDNQALLRKRFNSLHAVRDPDGMTFVWGTPHTSNSLYNYCRDSGWEIRKWPIYTPFDTGQEAESDVTLTWPERFDWKFVEASRTGERGRQFFLSQYGLIPTSAWESELALDNIIPYEGHPKWESSPLRPLEPPRLFLGDEQVLQVVAGWDTSRGHRTGDDSVLSIAFRTRNHFHLHRQYQLPPTTREEGFKTQARVVVQACMDNYVSSLYIEQNYQAHLTATIIDVSEEMQNSGKTVRLPNIVEFNESRNKIKRIADCLGPMMDNAKLMIHRDVLGLDENGRPSSQFFMESEEIPHNNSSPDYLDSATMALSNLVSITKYTDGFQPNASPHYANMGDGHKIRDLEGQERNVFRE